MDCTRIVKQTLHPDLAQLLTYCETIAGTAEVPRWVDFRPSAVPHLLAALYAAETIDNGADYHFRSYGALLPEFYGVDLRGKRLSDASDADFKVAIKQIYDEVLANRQPRALRSELSWPDNVGYVVDNLLVPFADQAGNVSIILGGAVCSVSRENLILFRGEGMARSSPLKDELS